MLKKAKIYSDGGARGNPGPAAIGVLICSEQGEPLQEHQEVIGEATNNVAEYTAVMVGLELARGLGIQEIDYFVDSELVAKQLSGQYRVKAPHILTLFQKVREQSSRFRRVVFCHVPRTHANIKKVDKMVNEALNLAGH
ncbi:MAG: ribonuclease HI family protein [Candidatus Omnitrophica bacterium]|nr:ribonuclease HI family protein [Candidatus Omnitrophota bacterium]